MVLGSIAYMASTYLRLALTPQKMLTEEDPFWHPGMQIPQGDHNQPRPTVMFSAHNGMYASDR